MGEIIELFKKRQERVLKLTPRQILDKYWDKRTVPVDIIQIAQNIKEFSFILECINSDFDNKFFASISNRKNNYILTYKSGISSDKLRLITAYALSYIIQGLVDKSMDKIVYIDSRMVMEQDPERIHEKIALDFAQELLIPLESVIRLIEVFKQQDIDSTIGNIAKYLEVINIYLVSNRLIELHYIK